MFLIYLIFQSFSFHDDEDGFMWGLDDEEEGQKEINWDNLKVHDLIILGSGPAGSTAALYSARAGYKPLVLHGDVPGGQLTFTSEIENFPGFNGTGTQLVRFMEHQATHAGASYKSEIIVSVDLSVFPRRLISENNVGYLCKSLIIATGAKAKYLGLENEQRLRNRGVSGCATCDGPLYTGQDVIVVGGGDVAVEEALYLTKICKSVTLVHRRNDLRASLPMKKKIMASTVKFEWDSVIEDVIGDDYLTSVQIKNIKTNKIKTLNVGAMFVAIGHTPETKAFNGQLDLDESGYFITNGSPETKIPGVFVAGDCADKRYRQAITSAGTGCQAALLAEKYLTELE